MGKERSRVRVTVKITCKVEIDGVNTIVENPP
jgi:hypothetical protein